MGTQSLPKMGRSSPISGPRLFWPNGCMDQDATSYGGRPRLRDIVLDGDPAHPPVKGHSPQFSAIVRCGQTAGWTKMPLGMEVGLGPGDFVFDGDPATHGKRPQPPHPIFGPCLLWPNGFMDIKMPLSTEVNVGPGDVVLNGVAAPP